MLLEKGTTRHPGVLGSLLQCLLDGLGIHPTRQQTKLVIVWILKVANVVLESVDKLLLSLHTIDVCNQGFSAKDLGAGLTPVNVRSVGIDCIPCDAFIVTLHIESRKWRLVMLLENGTIRHPSLLGSLLQCLLDGLGIHPTKQRTKLVIVWILNLENATPCISIIVTISVPFGVGHILIGMCIIIFHDWTCGINKFGIVDQENSVEVIVVKMMYMICMFGTDNSGFLQLNPSVLIWSKSVKPSIGR
jgi:hypothetical protein